MIILIGMLGNGITDNGVGTLPVGIVLGCLIFFGFILEIKEKRKEKRKEKEKKEETKE